MEYIGTREASKICGYSQSQISEWCRKGLIKGAEQEQKGCPWRIPINTIFPKYK